MDFEGVVFGVDEWIDDFDFCYVVVVNWCFFCYYCFYVYFDGFVESDGYEDFDVEWVDLGNCYDWCLVVGIFVFEEIVFGDDVIDGVFD